jgi:hypothetical protein
LIGGSIATNALLTYLKGHNRELMLVGCLIMSKSLYHLLPVPRHPRLLAGHRQHLLTPPITSNRPWLTTALSLLSQRHSPALSHPSPQKQPVR